MLYICGMAISTQELDELEKFFRSTPLPEKLKLNNAITQHDVPGIINECFTILQRNDISPRIMEMRVNILRQIKIALMAEQQQQ